MRPISTTPPASCDYPRPYSVTKADRDAAWRALVAAQVRDDAAIVRPLGVPSFRANRATLLRSLEGVEGLSIVKGKGTKLDGRFGGNA